MWLEKGRDGEGSSPPVETPLLLLEICGKDAGRTPHHAFLGKSEDTGLPFEDRIDVNEKSRSVSGTSRCLIEDVDRRHSATELAVSSCHGNSKLARLDAKPARKTLAHGCAKRPGRAVTFQPRHLQIGRASCRERVCQYV